MFIFWTIWSQKGNMQPHSFRNKLLGQSQVMKGKPTKDERPTFISRPRLLSDTPRNIQIA